ncbi:MAG: c-type cytochrome [Deltaproteobacteria bacterium]|nr:c-type cytochrome [Deltaproteobacteria bacterium]
MKRFFTMFLLFTIHYSLFTVVNAADAPSKPKPPATPELIAKGKNIYFKRCSFCHGLMGDGNGPAAEQMLPRPRDFTLGLYKFRSTETGALPTDEDLFRTISRGIPGSAMQTFDIDKIKNGLTEEERWQVIYYIKTYNEDFSDKELDPYQQAVKISKQVVSSAESISKGAQRFKEMKCWECHGDTGRGNGPNAPKLKDKFKGDPILPFDLTKGWRYKAGNLAEDIYKRFSTGLNGTPMPSFSDSLNDEERWHLANFVFSLQKRKVRNESVLKAMYVNGDIPVSPYYTGLAKAQAIDIQLAGQVIVKPRWENPSVDLVTVRAIYNDKEIAFLMEWGDRFKDTAHNPDLEYKVPAAYDGYVRWGEIPQKPGNFRDSIALQFPVKMSDGTKKPHFMRGDSGSPVNLWIWKSDLEESKQPSIEDVNASGPNQFKVQPQDKWHAKGKGVWNGGTWRVVIKRQLNTDDANDVQFEKGKFIPFSLNVWDGSNGEHNLLMSLSSWHYLIMEASTPISVYLLAILGIAITGIGEWWLVRRSRKER